MGQCRRKRPFAKMNVWGRRSTALGRQLDRRRPEGGVVTRRCRSHVLFVPTKTPRRLVAFTPHHLVSRLGCSAAVRPLEIPDVPVEKPRGILVGQTTGRKRVTTPAPPPGRRSPLSARHSSLVTRRTHPVAPSSPSPSPPPPTQPNPAQTHAHDTPTRDGISRYEPPLAAVLVGSINGSLRSPSTQEYPTPSPSPPPPPPSLARVGGLCGTGLFVWGGRVAALPVHPVHPVHPATLDRLSVGRVLNRKHRQPPGVVYEIHPISSRFHTLQDEHSPVTSWFRSRGRFQPIFILVQKLV